MGDLAPIAYAKCCAQRVELITISLTILSIWHKVCIQLFTFCKLSTAHLRILWRHLPTELRNVYCVAKYI